MKITKKEVRRRMALFETVCRAKGIKITHQRMEIFREVAQSGDHPDADQVYQRVRGRLSTVSLDTVYRTLWLLKDLNLIVTLSQGYERTRFDANLDEHHHFVCSRCGFTRDFYSDDLDTLSLPAKVDSYGRSESAHVEVRGICRQCLKKET